MNRKEDKELLHSIKERRMKEGEEKWQAFNEEEA